MFKGGLEKSLSFILSILVSFCTNYIKISKTILLTMWIRIFQFFNIVNNIFKI